MKLKPPESAISTSTAYNSLQREAADRVTQRYEDQRRKDCLRALLVGVKTLLEFILLIVLVGVGAYVWQRVVPNGWMASEKDAESAKIEMTGLMTSSVTEGKTLGVVPPNMVPSTRESEDVRNRNLDAYSEIVRQFRKAEVDYWKNALNVVRVGKNAGSIKYWCLAADEGSLPVIFELSIAKGTKMNVRRLSASNGLVDSSVAEFERFTAKSPYLVMREGRAYFASKGKERLPVTVSAPQKGGALNPAQLEFGGLYAIFTELKMPPPRFAYDVLFEVKGGDPVLKVATVRFGEDVSYDQFFSKVAEHYDLSESEAMVIDAVLKMGKARIVPAEAQAKR